MKSFQVKNEWKKKSRSRPRE